MNRPVSYIVERQMRRAALLCQLGFAKRARRIYGRCIWLARRLSKETERQILLARLYHGVGKCWFRQEEDRCIEAELMAISALTALNMEEQEQKVTWRLYALAGSFYAALAAAFERKDCLENAIECWMRAKDYFCAISPAAPEYDGRAGVQSCQELARVAKKCKNPARPERLAVACLAAGQQLTEEGEPIKASALFDRALALEEDWSPQIRVGFSEGLCCYARIKAEQGNWAQAEEKLSTALALLEPCGENIIAWMARARVWGCHAQLAAGVEEWRHAAEQADALYAQAGLLSARASNWRRSGEKWEKAKAFSTAEECYLRAISIYQEREHPLPEQIAALAEAQTHLGLCYYRMGDYQRELSCYGEAIRLRRQLEEGEENYDALCILYCNQADTLLKTGRSQEAGQAYQAAEALLLNAQGDYTESLARLHYEWAEHTKASPDGRRQAFDHYSKAIDYYEKADDGEDAGLGEYLAMAYNGRGVCRFAWGDYAGEVLDCSQALRLRAQFPASRHNTLQSAIVRKNRGECYELLGRYGEARQDFEKAAELYLSLEQEGKPAADEDLAELMISCGRMWDEQKDHEKAITWYTAALKRMEDAGALPVQTAELQALACFRRGMDWCRTPQHLYYLALRDYSGALDFLAKLDGENKAPLKAMVLRNRGDLYAAMNEYACADRDFMEAAALEREDQGG